MIKHTISHHQWCFYTSFSVKEHTKRSSAFPKTMVFISFKLWHLQSFCLSKYIMVHYKCIICDKEETIFHKSIHTHSILHAASYLCLTIRKSNLALLYITHTDWSPNVTEIIEFAWILIHKLSMAQTGQYMQPCQHVEISEHHWCLHTWDTHRQTANLNFWWQQSFQLLINAYTISKSMFPLH